MTNRSRILDNSNRQAQLVLDSFSSISPLYYWAARIDIRAFFCLFFLPRGTGETPERDCTEKTSPPLTGTAMPPALVAQQKIRAKPFIQLKNCYV
ncbi:MAG: hypothetical protein U1F55_05455 [Chitinivorax sp.]